MIASWFELFSKYKCHAIAIMVYHFNNEKSRILHCDICGRRGKSNTLWYLHL